MRNITKNMPIYLRMFEYKKRFSTHKLMRLEGMDYDTNVFKIPSIFQYAINLMFKHHTLTYSDFGGFPRLQKEILLHEKLISGIDNDSASVFVSQGASGILNTIIKVIKEYHDKKNAEVIMFAPEYSLFHTIISENNLISVVLKGKRKNSFLVDIDDIKHAINDNTIGIIFSNPNTPTCQTYSEKWISQMVNMCETKNISIIVDEIYRSTTYANNHVFIEKYNNGFKNLFKVFSLSKDRPGFTGIRSGYCIFDKKFKEDIRTHQVSQNFSNTIFADFLLLVDISMRNYLLTGVKSKDLKYFPQKYLDQYSIAITDFYKKQIEFNTYIIEELKKNEHIIDVIVPNAGNSVWFKYKDSLSPDEFVQTFIQKGLAIYAGDVFMGDYVTDDSWARVCVTKDIKELKKAIFKI